MSDDITIENPEAFRAQAATLLQGDAAEHTRGAAGDVAQGALELFCQRAPQGEEFLTMLQTVAPAIPGAGLALSIAIPIVIAFGKAAHRALCPRHGPEAS